MKQMLLNHAWQGAKSGQLLCVDDDTTYSVKVFTYRGSYGFGDPTVGSKGQLLSADANGNEPVIPNAARSVRGGMGYTRTAPPLWFHWQKMNLCAMTVAGNRLYVAGAPLEKNANDPFAPYEGRAGAMLLTFDKKTGEKLSELELGDQPVFDGLIAANRRLYATTMNGKIICLGKLSNQERGVRRIGQSGVGAVLELAILFGAGGDGRRQSVGLI